WLPARVALAAAVTALLVLAFRWAERPAGRPRAGGSAPLAAAGVTLSLLGVLGLSMTGYGGLLTGRTATLIAVPVTAPQALALVLAGWLLVELRR
ncbi:acyltransferase, partial [Streptomyces sp. NPDC052644]